jgi:hypothetical protein
MIFTKPGLSAAERGYISTQGPPCEDCVNTLTGGTWVKCTQPGPGRVYKITRFRPECEDFVKVRPPTRVEITQPVETKRHLFRIHYRFTHISLGSGKKESLPAANMGIGWRRQVKVKQLSNSETCRRYISK